MSATSIKFQHREVYSSKASIYRARWLVLQNRFNPVHYLRCEFGDNVESLQVIKDLLRFRGSEDDSACVRVLCDPRKCQMRDGATKHYQVRVSSINRVRQGRKYLVLRVRLTHFTLRIFVRPSLLLQAVHRTLEKVGVRRETGSIWDTGIVLHPR